MGYGATNGALYIQAYLSDRIMTPADFAPYYSEKLFILPVPFYVTSYKADAERQEELVREARSRTNQSEKDYTSVAPVKYPTVAGWSFCHLRVYLFMNSVDLFWCLVTQLLE
jgi:hypothetical protein